MTWVKVCGLSSRRDVETAADAGADAVGFVIAPGSPRQITIGDAARLGSGIEITKVLVSKDLTSADLVAAADEARVEAVQPHGLHASEAAVAARGAGLVVLYPVAVNGSIETDNLAEDLILMLDGANPGTGQGFDWSLVENLARPFVLSGGLRPDNVADAIARLKPWGVDASSGLESQPGVKSPELIRQFVTAAKKR